MQGLRLKGGARVCANKAFHFHLLLYHPTEPATIVATPYSGQCHLVKKKSESTCHFDVCFFLAYFFSC